MRDVVTVKGNWTLGGSQVFRGWSKVDDIRFTLKKKYRHWQETADYERKGGWGKCVSNYGTPRHPYNVATTFNFGPWRYQFGPTDSDAWPEMQAESLAMPGSVVFTGPPLPGWVFVRVPVTVTRLEYPGVATKFTSFSYMRGGDEYDQFGDDNMDQWCGTGDAYVDGQTLDPGESFTGYVCAAIPAPMSGSDQWVVFDRDFNQRRVSVD